MTSRQEIEYEYVFQQIILEVRKKDKNVFKVVDRLIEENVKEDLVRYEFWGIYHELLDMEMKLDKENFYWFKKGTMRLKPMKKMLGKSF